jgi:apolipoprotein N-acyltransferase
MTARGLGRTALAVLSGVAYWAACPPCGLWPLALVCWVPLLVAMRACSRRQAALLGGVQGVVANLLLAVWLPEVVGSFGPLSPVACWGITFVLCAYNAGGVALCAWASHRAASHGWSAGAAFVLAVAVKEAFYPLLFPVVAAVQVHQVPELVASFVDRRRASRAWLAVAVAAPLVTLLFGLWRMAVIDARVGAAPEARIAIVQANTPHAGTTLRAAIESHVVASQRIESEGPVDLLVWPETALAGAIATGELETTLRREVLHGPGDAGVARLRTPVLSGAMLRHGHEHTNSAVLFDPSGAVHGIYDKAHPLVFGEYIPLGDRFPKLYRWLGNAGRLTAGSLDQPALPLGEHRIATLICYEDLLAGYTNDVARQTHPDLLVNLSNDSWFGDSSAAATHFAMATLRAVEHRRYLVVASNSGVSGFVDPSGRSSLETSLLEAATRVGVVHWMSAPTLYERVGETPWWLAACAVAAMLVVPRRRLEEAMVLGRYHDDESGHRGRVQAGAARWDALGRRDALRGDDARARSRRAPIADRNG